MPSITEREFKASYDLGKRIFEGKTSKDDAVTRLIDDYQMNPNSARQLLLGFKKLMGGSGSVNNINTDCLRYYFENIQIDFGDRQIGTCLDALEFYLTLVTSFHSLGKYQVHNEFSEKIGRTPIYSNEGEKLNEGDIKYDNDAFEDISRKKIGEKEIEASYELGIQVYKKNMSSKDAVARLVNDYQMNRVSARTAIKFLLSMLAPEKIRRSLSQGHVAYYASRVFEDFEAKGLKTFLKGLEYHIKYRQSRGHKVPGFCAIHNEFSEKIGRTPIYSNKGEKLNKGEINYDNDTVEDIPRKKIGKREREIEASYELAIQVYKGNMSGKDAVASLVDDYQMNANSANISINFLLSMLAPKEIRRALSQGHVTYYANRVFEDFGADKLKDFLKGLEFHIKYRQSIRQSVPSLCGIHSEFSEKIGMPLIYSNKGEKLNEGKINYDNEAFEAVFDIGGKEEKHSTASIKEEKYSTSSIVEDGCFIEQGKLEEILENLKNKKNLILQGPPGTGKTWLAKRLGYTLIGEKDRNKIMAVQFHPNMSYEDFIMGYRPNKDGKLDLIKGAFLKFVDKAKDNPDENYVMVIEEINRGNPAQIFGEILTLLEADKRNQDEALHLSYQDEDKDKDENLIFIPENIYLIGTMNLADRSLAVVDFALRRRFAFINLKPELNQLWLEFTEEKFLKDKGFVKEIQARMQNLNDKIKNDYSLGKQFCIGHSFITPTKKILEPKTWFKQIVKFEIKPLLEEYWFDAIETAEDSEDSKTKIDNAIEDLLSEL